MDETKIKVKGKKLSYYRAIDKHGKTLDIMLSELRDEAAAPAFFIPTIQNNGFPDKVVIEILQVKYLNNIIEQDHRFVQKLTRAAQGFKSAIAATTTLEGIEVAHMIHTRQFGPSGQSAFQQFTARAG